MLFKDLLKREFLYEEIKKNNNKKSVYIFYKFDINLIKKKDQGTPQLDDQVKQQVDQMPPAAAEPTPDQNAPAQTPAPAPEPSASSPASVNLDNALNDVPPQPAQQSSIYTEDDDKKGDVEITDDNNVVRKLEGQIEINSEQVDQISTMEDIVNILIEERKSGVQILDEFTSGIILSCLNNQFQEINNMIDRKSKIFCDITIGTKVNDSLGIRIKKVGDQISTNILVDNELFNVKYSPDLINKRLVNFRNEYFQE